MRILSTRGQLSYTLSIKRVVIYTKILPVCSEIFVAGRGLDMNSDLHRGHKIKFQSDTYQTLSQFFPHCKYCNAGPGLRTKLLSEKSLKLSDQFPPLQVLQCWAKSENKATEWEESKALGFQEVLFGSH